MVNSDNSTILSEENSSTLEVVGYDYVWIDWSALMKEWGIGEDL